MREVVVIDAIRTPVGKRNGALSGIRAEELAAIPLAEIIKRSGINPSLIEDVVMGCVTQHEEQGMNIGRVAALIAGFPDTVPSVTLDRMCGSGQQAVHFAAQAILAGDMDVVIAAGVESMSRVAMGSDYPKTLSEKLTSRYPVVLQGISAEMIADRWNVSREEMDEFAYTSHIRAGEAIEKRCFVPEIVPVEVEDADGKKYWFKDDQGPRKDTTLEKMSSLKPAFKEDGKITAAQSSQISDGSAAMLLMSSDKAKELGLKPRARIAHRVVTANDPVINLTAPIPATRKILERSGMGINDFDAIEINEAFASVVMAWKKEFNPDMGKVNAWGGAIALGHPLGCSGVKLMATLINRLEQTGGRYGLQTMCIGHGQATATIIERL